MPRLPTEELRTARAVEVATENVQKFFKKEQKAAIKKIKELIAVHSADAGHAGNAKGKYLIRSFGVEVLSVLNGVMPR